MMSTHALLRPAQAAERLELSVAELTDLIEVGEGQTSIEIGSIVGFLGRDVDQWAGAINQQHQ